MQKVKSKARPRKVLTLFLALVLVFSMMPYVPSAFAEEGELTPQEGSVSTEAEQTTEALEGTEGSEPEGTEEESEEPSGKETEVEPEVEADEEDGEKSDETTPAEATEEQEDAEEIAPLSVVDGTDSLTVTLNGDDVDTLGNQVTWNYAPGGTNKKLLQIAANFSDLNIDKTRKIEVTVPQGYKILEYTAKIGSPAINGVGQTFPSQEKSDRIRSVALTARDGSDWTAQKIYGYTTWGTATEGGHRVYDGKVVYEFNKDCDNIVLSLTLDLDPAVIPHVANSTYDSLDELSVEMTSGAKTLDTGLTTKVGDLSLVQVIFASPTVGGSRTIEGEASGTIPAFRTSNGLGSHLAATGAQTVLVEKAVYTVSYPAGITFEGFEDRKITGTSEPTDNAGGTYADGHLVVAHDPIARTVTFTYNDVRMTHGSNDNVFSCWWSGQVDGSTINWGDNLLFPATLEVFSGEYVAGSSQSFTSSDTVNLKIEQANWSISLASANKTRHDLNYNGDYPYDYMLGGIKVANTGPSKAEDLTYKWEFDASLGVRAVTFPGVTGNDITDVVAKTSKGRVLTAAGPFVATGTVSEGTCVNGMHLGLDPDEHILELTAKQASLDYNTYSNSYIYSAAQYYGRFQAGQEGDAKLSVYDGSGALVASGIDHTTIGWTNSASGTVSTTVAKSDGTTGASFYPNDSMSFSSTYTRGHASRTQNDIVDPEIVISLPEGINLDQSSVKAVSVAGNHGSSAFPLQLKSMNTQNIGGVDWVTYIYKSPNHQDMIAMAQNLNNGTYDTRIKVNFDANVASTCDVYSLAAQDLVRWDLGQTAANATSSTSYVIPDSGNRTGKGESYNVSAGTTSAAVHVIQQPGFQVSLGIRTAGSGTAFYTYDGTAATVAPVTPSNNAEIWLKYENTSQSAYEVGTEIYLPIPKKNQGFDKYFNNTEIQDPVNINTSANPQWSGILSGPISLPGFTTYYSTDVSTTTSNDSGGTPPSWVPVSGSWSPTVVNYADVTMVKFVATAPILGGASDQTTFQMGIDAAATLGQIDYWRTFQKGWTDTSGSGAWAYGSVLAAEPSKAGVLGMLFDDVNADGTKAATGEAIADPSKYSIMLTEQNGGIVPLNMTIESDGSFASKQSDGTPYFLKAGTYTVTITNNSGGTFGFTPTTSATRSSAASWEMDVAQTDIATNHSTATYTFTVAPGSSLSSEYVGVGVKSASVVTYRAGTGVTFADVTETLNHNMSPSTTAVPQIQASHAQAGYDHTKQSWKLDKNVKLKDGTPIAAGTAITRAQLLNVVVTENLVATVSLAYGDYKLSFDSQGANEAATLDILEISVTYDTTLSTVASFPANPTKANNTFKGWQYEDPSSPGTMLWLSTTTKMPSQDLELVAVWVPSTGSGNDGDIRIAASDFLMSKAELSAYTAANATTKLSTLVTKGDASAWYDSDKSAVAISSAIFVAGTPTGPGTYQVTYTATDGTDSASVTVNAIIHDQVDGTIGANNFSRDVKDGTITAAQAITFADATVYDAFASATTETPGVNATELAAINTAITNKVTGNYPLTFTNAAGDSVTITVTLTRSIYDVTFDSQGANEASTLDTLVVPVTKATVIKNASGFPAEPTKTGFTFKGWQYDNPASPGTNIWLTNASLMPSANVALTAVWVPSSGSGDDGDIRIVATNFLMSKAELATFTAASSAVKKSTLITKGNASAWYTTDMSNALITDAEFDGSIPTGPGTYPVTYTADDGTDSASVTVNAVIHDQVDGTIGANNFSRDVKDGTITAAQAITFADATVYDAFASATTETPGVNATELAAINTAITNKVTGNYPLTFTNAAGDSVTITVTLTRSIYDVTFDSQGANEAATLDTLVVPVTKATVIKNASGFPAEPTKTGFTFKGWQYDNPASPGTNIWLTNASLMPSANVALTAVWVPSSGSGDDGDIRIVATNFLMSKAELATFTAASSAVKKSTLITKGNASAWYTTDMSAATITDAEFDNGVPTGPGTYPVTYTADDGTDSASVTVNAIIHDQVDGSLGANNFSRDVKDGAITAAQAASLASATVYDALGSATTEVPVADATHLAAINAAIASKTTGDYPLKFTNAAGDEVTITVTLTRSIFDVTFDSQGANEAATLDTLVVPVTKATVIKNASGFPAEPTKPGFTFKGWQYDNPASPGTNIWLTNTSLMPAANVALTAVWVPSSGSGDDGDIRIVASNFVMSKAELDAYSAANTSTKLSTLVTKGSASAWYTTDMSTAVITEAEFVGGTPTGPGTYQVTYTAADGTDSASVTITAIIYDQVDGSLGANNFSHDVKDGTLSASDVVSMADATVFDALGVDTGEVPVPDATELAAINTAINNNTTGDFPLTFTNIAGDSVTITVTLTRSIHDLTFDSKGADNASNYDSLVLKVNENTVVKDATGFPVDPTKDGYVFRGWQYEDPANPGAMLWLTDATLMPSDHLQLVAVWERGTVITVGDITIVASPFTMTVKEAAAYEAMNPSDRLSYIVGKGNAKAWRTDTKVDEPITAIDIIPVSGTSAGLSAGKGKYNVTYYAGTGTEEVSVTVLATVFDTTTPPKPDTSSIGGNNFTYDIQKGELTEDQIRELASITVYDKYGRPTGEKAILTPADLDTINKMIREGKTGKTSLTFTNAAGQTITVECELFNSKVDPEPKDPTDPTDKDKKTQPKTGKTYTSAKTGDMTPVMFIAIGLVASALLLLLLLVARRRRNEN